MTTEQHKVENERIKPMYTTTVLSEEEFKEFYTFLNIIKMNFNDFFLVDGVFRSRNNDRDIIVTTNFRYFRNMDFSIANIKELVEMLSTLKKAEITVFIDENCFNFSDGYQSAQMPKVYMEPTDNEFISEEEINDIFFKNFDVNKPFIKETKPKIVVCNINKLTLNKYNHNILVMQKNDDLNKAFLVVPMGNGGTKFGWPEYTVKFEEEFLIPMKKNHYFRIGKSPFIFKKADMTFNFYIDNSGPTLSAIYNTTVDGLFINIYTREVFVGEDEIYY